MSSLPETLRLYLKVAVDRRQMLARHLAIRIALGGMAAIVLLTGLALLNVALFLVLRPLLGDVGSVLAVAALHVAAGAALATYALSEPSSAELRALAEAEAAALHALDTDAEDALASIANAQHRIERIGSGLTSMVSALPGLISLLNTPARRRPTAPPSAAVSNPAANDAGDKT